MNFQEFIQLVLERPHTKLKELPDLSKPSRYKGPVSKNEKRQGFLSKIEYLGSFSRDHLNTAASELQNDSISPTVTQLWREVLGIKKPEPNLDFRSAGGNSILAMDLAYRIQQTFRLSLPGELIIESSTISQLSAWIRKNSSKSIPSDRLSPLVLEPVKPKRLRKIGYKLRTHFSREVSDPTPTLKKLTFSEKTEMVI